MSVNTTLRTNLVFPCKTYRAKSEVEEALEFRTMNMHDTLWDIIRQNVNLSSSELNQLVEELEDIIIDKYKLELLLDGWDRCHTEDGRPKPSDRKHDPEIWGDFLDLELDQLK